MELYHNDSFIELLHSETFWVAVAFFIFVILSFKKIKKILIESLDKRIKEIKIRINEAKKIKEEAEINLKEAKKNLKKIIDDKKRIIEDTNEEAKILKDKLLNEEKIYNQRFEKKIIDRIEQSKNQAIIDIKKIALEISIKSILELFKKEKDVNEIDSIAKSVTNLFDNKEKEEKNYKELWVPSQNGDFFVCLQPHK